MNTGIQIWTAKKIFLHNTNLDFKGRRKHSYQGSLYGRVTKVKKPQNF